ncbi:MAG TPA: hypothetical protein VFF06_35605 [Polyangia bacterium]|nr:hypothetical protein [Polyangia bacterium]
MGSRNFKDDDTTRPDNAPALNLDVSDAPLGAPGLADAPTAPAVTAPVRAHGGKPASARPGRVEEAGSDELWAIYESALRAWGKMTIKGAPADLEHAVVSGCSQLRAYLQSLGTPARTPDDHRRAADDERRIAILAVQLKAAIDDYDAWLAQPQ